MIEANVPVMKLRTQQTFQPLHDVAITLERIQVALEMVPTATGAQKQDMLDLLTAKLAAFDAARDSIAEAFNSEVPIEIPED